MNEGRREDAILWEGKPDAGFFGGRGSLTVPQYQVGIVMQDGKVVDIFSERKKKLPRKGEVRTYVASTAPFTLTFWLMDPMDREEPDDGVVLGQPVLTSDDEAVTGRLALTMRVVRKNVEYLLQLLRPGRGGVTRRDVSDAIGGELLAKVLDLDIHQHTAEELRGNRDLFRGIYKSVNIELASTIRFYGLQLDNFTVSWGLTSEERERIRERRHEEELREIRRQQEIEDLANRERERRHEEELAEMERERERERRHEEELAEMEREKERERRHEEELREIRRQREIEDLANRERERRHEEELAEIERERERRHEEELRDIKRRRDLLGKQDGGWIEIGYSFKNGRESMEDVPDWVKEQIPKYNRMFHTTDRDSGSMSYHFDGGAFTYRISFARVYGGADVRVSRMLMEESGGNFPPAGNYPAPEVSRPGVGPQRPGGYWVYEDRPTSRARVHEGTCRYCNHGDGMGRGRIEAENEWYGPFVSRDDAFRRAGATGQRDVRGCGVCRP